MRSNITSFLIAKLVLAVENQMIPPLLPSTPVLRRRPGAGHVAVAAILQDGLERPVVMQPLEVVAAAQPSPADEDLSTYFVLGST